VLLYAVASPALLTAFAKVLVGAFGRMLIDHAPFCIVHLTGNSLPARSKLCPTMIVAAASTPQASLLLPSDGS